MGRNGVRRTESDRPLAAGMATRLSLSYDREGDILHLDVVTPYAEQVSDEVGDAVVVRTNPENGRVENIEILSFSRRFAHLGDAFELPVIAALELAEPARGDATA